MTLQFLALSDVGQSAGPQTGKTIIGYIVAFVHSSPYIAITRKNIESNLVVILLCHSLLVLSCFLFHYLMRVYLYDKIVESVWSTIIPYPAHILIAVDNYAMTLEKQDDLTKNSVR